MVLRIFAAAFGISALLVSSASFAQEKTEDECMRLHPEMTSQVEIATCTSDLAGSKKVLNRAYGALVKKITPDHPDFLPSLEKAQKAWLEYRIAQCTYDAGGNPGSTGNSASVIDCTADMNRKRAAYLEDDLKRW